MPFLRLILTIIIVACINMSDRLSFSLYSYDIGRREENFFYSFINFIHKKVRRFLAVGKARKFISKYKDTYKLKNPNMTLIYDDKRLEITCIEKGQNKRKTIISKEDYKYNVYNDADENFRREFDNICSFFSQYTTCDDIRNILDMNYNIKDSAQSDNNPNDSQQNFIYVDDYLNYQNKKNESHYNKQYTKPEYEIDINSANEEEIAKLPGINIILAKKIIDYRNLNNGFKSKEEFYKKMKIKPHFQKQLDRIILVSEFEWKENNTGNNERIIDF